MQTTPTFTIDTTDLNIKNIIRGRAFTHEVTIEDKVVIGNPASIVFCNVSLPSKEEMQRIAIKENAPMTAFILQREGQVFDIEFYTPSGKEFGLCGHATLIASNYISKQYGFEKVTFIRKGLEKNLETNNKAFNGKENYTQVCMPAIFPLLQDINLAKDYFELINLLPENLVSFYRCSQLNDIIFVVNNINALRNVRPNFDFLAKKLLDDNVRGLFVTALSTLENIDYEVRIFAPHFGINEDISCGSANCSLLPLWHKITNTNIEKQFTILCPYNYEKGNLGGIEIGSYNSINETIEIGGRISNY